MPLLLVGCSISSNSSISLHLLRIALQLLRHALSPAVVATRQLPRCWRLRLLASMRRRLLLVCCTLLISASTWLMFSFHLLLPHMAPRMLRARARLGCPPLDTLLLLEMMIRVCRSLLAFRCRLLGQTCFLHVVQMLLQWHLRLCDSHVLPMRLWPVASVHLSVLLATLLMMCACLGFVWFLTRSLWRHVLLLGLLLLSLWALLLPSLFHVWSLLAVGIRPL